ncbi:MAG: hypothetical protein Q9217_001682 [Psora testacea]
MNAAVLEDCLIVCRLLMNIPWYRTPQIFGHWNESGVQRELPFRISHQSCYFGLLIRTTEPDVKDLFALSDVYPAVKQIRRSCVRDKPDGERYGGFTQVGTKGFVVVMQGNLKRDVVGNVSTMQFGDGPITTLPTDVTGNESDQQVTVTAPLAETCLGGHQRGAPGGACTQ